MKKLLFILFTSIAFNATAGSSANGNLYQVHFMKNGEVIVYSSGSRVDVPSCASQPLQFAIDATTEGGKVQLAGLLAAYAAGKKVTIIGLGVCSVHGSSETINYFYTND